jgi:translation elongation factor EF-G
VIELLEQKALIFGDKATTFRKSVPDELKEAAAVSLAAIERSTSSPKKRSGRRPQGRYARRRRGKVSPPAARKNKGVQPLLDAVVDYLPSPMDVPPMTGTNPRTGEQEIRRPDPKDPFCALAFKIVTDPFVGKLAFIRVYSGTLKTGSYAYNSTRDQRERVGRLVQLHANERKDIPECKAGEIAAIVGPKGTVTGDTLCDEDRPIVLEAITFPEPVIRVAIEPKTKRTRTRWGSPSAN